MDRYWILTPSQILTDNNTLYERLKEFQAFSNEEAIGIAKCWYRERWDPRGFLLVKVSGEFSGMELVKDEITEAIKI